MLRYDIIRHLSDGLVADEAVYAFWLEGADATGTVDTFSDIDIVVDVADGSEDRVLARVEALLGELGPVDLRYERPSVPGPLRTRFFHLAGTPEWLLIDFTVQSHSRAYEFVTEDADSAPQVLWDKAGVIRFRRLDRAGLAAEIRESLSHLENTVRQKGRAVKYTQRGLFLEATAYYHRYVLSPLVQVLRMKYAPIYHEHFLVHISRHLPGDVVARLEGLYRVASCEEMAGKIEAAVAWFWATAAEVRAGRDEHP